MATIRPIPRAVHSSIRSGTVLFDLTRVVEELVYNSLDAGAEKVTIYVGVETCCVKVVDDGSGVTRDGLMLLGEKYATSKLQSLEDMDAVSTIFGFRGEALASISDISLVEIVTKTRGRPNGYRKIIKGCKCLYLGVDDSRQDIGTTVTVRDLFHNQPVRRKHMHSSPRKVLHLVKKCVLHIALMQPNTRFTVIDLESEEQLFFTQPSTSPMPLLMKNFGADTCEHLLDLNCTDGTFRLSGHITRPQDTYSSKALQFIYINLRYVGKCFIHKLLNELASRFTCLNLSTVRKSSRTQANSSYILNITCARSLYDLYFEPSNTSVEFKDWSPLLTFMERTIMKFWKERHNGDVLGTVAVHEADDKPFPLKEEEVHGIPKRISLLEMLTEKRRHKSDKDFVSIPSFDPGIDIDEIEKQQSASEFVYRNKSCACDHHLETNWSREDNNMIQHVEEEVCDADDKFQPRSPKMAERFANIDEDYSLHSRLDDDPFQINLKKLNKSGGRVPCDDLLDFSNGRDKFRTRPFLQSCSSRRSTSDDRILWINDVQTDTFLPEKTHISLSDSVDGTEDDGYDKNTFLSTSWQVGLLTSAYSPDEKQTSYRTKSLLFSDGILCTSDVQTDTSLPERTHSTQFNSMDATEDGCYKRNFATTSWQVRPLTSSYSPDKKHSRYRTKCLCEDLFDVVDEVPYDCYLTEDDQDDLPGTSWKVDPATDLFAPSCRRTARLDRDNKPKLLQEMHHTVTEVDFLHDTDKDLSNFYSDNCSSGIQDRYSIFEGTPGYTKKRSGQNPFDFELKRRKGTYDDGFVYHGVEDFSVNDGSRLNDGDKERNSIDREFKRQKIINNDAQTHFDRGNFSPSERADPNVNNVGLCFDFCYMDNALANGCTTSLFKDISPLGFENENHRKQCHVDDHSRRKKIRSCSAPPFFRRKKKFFVLFDYTSEEQSSDTKSSTVATRIQEIKMSKDLQQSCDASPTHIKPSSMKDLFYAGSDNKPGVALDMQVTRETKRLRTSGNHSIPTSFSFEDFSSKEADESIEYGTKWRDCYPSSTVEQAGNFHRESYSHDQQNILDVSSGILHLAAESLVPKSIDKDCLMDAEVLQQIDKKFILIVGKGILAVIDQHAADERIRLEELRREVLSGEVRKTIYLDLEQEMELPEMGYQLLHKYALQIEKWGWICDFHAHVSESFTKNMNLLHTSSTKATIRAVPCILGINLTDVDLLEFLKQLADTDGSSTVPPAVFRILNSKACRGAIMFGDTLLPSECSLLVEELKQTSLCFQCAHGRPTMAPLVDLRALHQQIASLPTSTYKPWHGLYRHQISIDRAQKQLNPARG